jgi:hypothetical protein
MKILENIKRLPLWRKIALVFVLAGIAMVAGLMMVTYVASNQLAGEVIKISKAGEPITFSALNPGQSPQGEAEDANRYYTEAVNEVAPSELEDLRKVNRFYSENLVSLPANQFPSDFREKISENLVKAAPVFANLDKGAKLELSSFDTGLLQGRNICKQCLDSIQGVVLWLSLRTLDFIRSGDGDKAADSIASELKLMRVFDSYPTIFVQSRKMMCLRLVCRDIYLLLSRSQVSDQRLEMLQSVVEESFRPDALERTLLAERIYQLEVARNLIPKHIASEYLASDVPSLPERLALPDFTWHRMRFFQASVRFMRDMAWLIKTSRLPWPGPLNEIKDANSAPSGKTSTLISSAVPLARLTAETLATVRCTVVIIAVERYRRQEKILPDTLADIQPRYIQSTPLDPFTGQPIGYSHTDKSYMLSSAGGIRTDDVNSITPASQGKDDYGAQTEQ